MKLAELYSIQCPECVLSKSEQTQTSLLINIVFLGVMGLMW